MAMQPIVKVEKNEFNDNYNNVENHNNVVKQLYSKQHEFQTIMYNPSRRLGSSGPSSFVLRTNLPKAARPCGT